MRVALSQFLSQVDSIERTIDLRDNLVQFGLGTRTSADTTTELLRQLVTQIGQRGLQPSLDGSVLLLAAAFEQYISDVMVAYSADLPTKIVAYSQLPDAVQSNNEQLTGEALSRRRSRFTAYELQRFVDNLRNCHMNLTPYTLNGEAMALNDRNLNANILKNLFNRLGIVDIWDVVGSTLYLSQWYGIASSKNAVSRAKNDLNEFINNRNRIAHSVGRITPGPVVVREYLGFQRSLAESLVESLENHLNSL